MNAILENKELMIGLVEAETPVQLAALFAQHGIVLEDGLTIEAAFDMVKAQENGELSEDSLDDVNGGIALTVALGAAAALTMGGAAISFISGYAYQKYKNYKKKKK